jgi:hypothetical protein
MVVNSPNFRRAFHEDASFRGAVDGEFLEIFHFDRAKNGPPFTLKELREFHRATAGNGKGLFNRDMPPQFTTAEFDHELDVLQSTLPQTFVEETPKRDPLFTEFVDEAMKDDLLRRELGPFYSAYEVAYDLMRDDVRKSSHPSFGIVHFDHMHSDRDTPNILDYLLRLPRMKKWSAASLQKEIGERVAKAHRALMVRSELTVMGARAILPVDLKDYRTLVLPAAGRIDGKPDEEIVVPIDTAAFDVDTFARLTADDIRECRKAGDAYFDVVDRLNAGIDVPIDAVGNVLKIYVGRLNRHLARATQASPRQPSRGGALRIARVALSKGRTVSEGAGLLVSVLSSIGTSAFHVLAPFVPAGLAGAAKTAAASGR